MLQSVPPSSHLSCRGTRIGKTSAIMAFGSKIVDQLLPQHGTIQRSQKRPGAPARQYFLLAAWSTPTPQLTPCRRSFLIDRRALRLGIRDAVFMYLSKFTRKAASSSRVPMECPASDMDMDLKDAGFSHEHRGVQPGKTKPVHPGILSELPDAPCLLEL